MTFTLVQNTSKHNRGHDINNGLRYVSYGKRKHSCIHPTSNLLIIIKSNCFLKLQCFLKMDNFACKSTKEKNIFSNLLLIENNHKNFNIYISLIRTLHHILRNYLIFISIFNFFGAKLYTTHVLFHSCGPFPNCFAKLYISIDLIM